MNSENLFEENNFSLAEINALIACIKVNTLESTTKAFSEAWLSCGGIGFSHYAGISHWLNDHHVQETWEGDNNVLIQQTSKFLLEVAKQKFKGKDLKTYSCNNWLKIDSIENDKFGDDVTNLNLIKAL